jgi:hypothetical protein
MKSRELEKGVVVLFSENAVVGVTSKEIKLYDGVVDGCVVDIVLAQNHTGREVRILLSLAAPGQLQADLVMNSAGQSASLIWSQSFQKYFIRGVGCAVDSK